MTATTFAWLVLAFPLAGTLIVALGYRSLPGRTPGWIGTAAVGGSFICALGALVCLVDSADKQQQREPLQELGNRP